MLAGPSVIRLDAESAFEFTGSPGEDGIPARKSAKNIKIAEQPHLFGK